MLKKMIQLILILLFISPLTSCGGSYKHTVNKVVPRNSFVYLKKVITIRRCDYGVCSSVDIKYSASGYIVKTVNDGSFAVTAGHVCREEQSILVKPKNILSKYFAYRLDGKEYRASVLSFDMDIDTCMIFIKGLTEGAEAMNISEIAPKPGDKIYNIAAPLGIYKPDIVPILEGRYNGEDEYVALYTLPAAPGSSGSMIVNEDGELIGMVHSVFINFPVMTLSTKYEDLKNFINKNLVKYITYKKVMHVLELEDVFEPKP